MKNKSANIEELAINGGVAIRKEAMPFRCAFGDEEVKTLNQAIEYYRTNYQDPPYQGIFEKRFCEDFSKYMGGGYTDAVATGTASVFVALAALELPKGSEVIISPVTDSGPLNSIIMQGYKPVVADSKPGSYNMGVEQFLQRVSSDTSALIAVHLGGEPLEIDLIVKEAGKREIKVLEDCSQATGAEWKGQKVGSFGDIAAFSTMYRKNLAAGASGGLVYTRNFDLYEKALAYADRGKQVLNNDINQNDPGNALFPALNFNTDELSCAIGISSLKRLPDTIKLRLNFISSLVKAINEKSMVCKSYNFHAGFSPFFLPIFVNTDKVSCTKIQFAKALKAEGINLNEHYGCVISDWKWAEKYLSDDFKTKNAIAMKNDSFNLFINENYGDNEVNDIVRAIDKIEQYYKKY